MLTQSVGCDIEDDILEEILVCCLSLIGWKMIMDACAPRRSELVYIYSTCAPYRVEVEYEYTLYTSRWVKVDTNRWCVCSLEHQGDDF